MLRSFFPFHVALRRFSTFTLNAGIVLASIACLELLERMAKTDPANRSGDVCVLAINTRGDVGAASMRSGYRLKYALWRGGESQLLDAVALY